MVARIENEDPGLLNNITTKYCGTPLSNWVEMDQDPQIYRTQLEKIKKKCCASMKNHDF
jgi:hypothetical protein